MFLHRSFSEVRERERERKRLNQLVVFARREKKTKVKKKRATEEEVGSKAGRAGERVCTIYIFIYEDMLEKEISGTKMKLESIEDRWKRES